MLEIEDQYKRRHLQLEKEIHEQLLKEVRVHLSEQASRQPTLLLLLYIDTARQSISNNTQANRRGDVVSSLKKRLHVLENSLAKKEQEAAADLRSQQICLAIFALSTNALDKPGPFKKQLERALEVTAGHEVVQEALSAIPQSIATRGVAPIQEVRVRRRSDR